MDGCSRCGDVATFYGTLDGTAMTMCCMCATRVCLARPPSSQTQSTSKILKGKVSDTNDDE